MALDIDNPEEELARLDRVIKQYEIVLKTTSDSEQESRVRYKLKKLAAFRENLLQAFDFSKRGTKEREEKQNGSIPLEFAYLDRILSQDTRVRLPKPGALDLEIHHLRLYLKYFDEELLVVFSERKMRLDFQHSMERDGFYHKFQDVERRLSDYEQELVRIEDGDFDAHAKSEMRKRTQRMKRVLIVETHRLLKSVLLFAKNLIEDIDSDGTQCLNGRDYIYFDALEGKRLLEGRTVLDALRITRDFVTEVMSFLNVPDFEVQE
jgi:hypothetical protein